MRVLLERILMLVLTLLLARVFVGVPVVVLARVLQPE